MEQSELKQLAEELLHGGQRRAETEWGRLYNRIVSGGNKSAEEWLQLQREVEAFFAGEHPEHEKEKLGEVAEMLSMICQGILYNRDKTTQP